MQLTTRAILIHGCCEEEEFYREGPSSSNKHWLPWLQKQLVTRGIETQTPEMPEPFKPEYTAWKRILDRLGTDEETLLVGHSCGGGCLLRWITEERLAAQNVFLVAPWLDPFRVRGAFLDFQLNPAVSSRVRGIHLLYSRDDKVEGVKESVAQLSSVFPNAKTHCFTDRGHFGIEDLGTERFPELLNLIVGGDR